MGRDGRGSGVSNPEPPAAGTDPLALLSGLVLDTGQRWGEAAEPWQREDAAAVLSTDAVAPRRHFALRARGMSKTTDAGALALALLLTQAPARSRSHAYAVDADQAAILADTIGGMAARSGLGALVECGPKLVTVKPTGATLAIENSDGASAYGLRPWLTVCDELGLWPGTSNFRTLWAAVTSALPKVKGSRLLAIGTAGSPSSLGAGVWAEAEASPFWRTSRHPGPAPWWAPEDIAATRAGLTSSEWRRLILCEWAEGDDALTTPEDVAACIRPGSLEVPPQPGIEYVAALDVGTRRDLTALAVGHAERREAGRVVVIDRLLYWRPKEGPSGRVDLGEVEAACLRVCRAYRVSRLRFDRMQAEMLTSNLARQGVRVAEYVFSASGADKLARALYGALRDRSLELPDDDEVRAEGATVRMVETGPSTVRMSNPAGTHDDVLTAVGMVAVDLLTRTDYGSGRVTVPGRGRTFTRTNQGGRAQPPAHLAARQAAQGMPRGLPGGGAIVGVPGAWDNPLGDAD